MLQKSNPKGISVKKFLPAIATISAISIAAVSIPALATTSAPEPDPAFLTQLRTALQTHPELIQQAMQAAQVKAQADRQRELVAKVTPYRAELFNKNAIGPVLGNPNGSVTVVEYLDYACPFCKQAHTSVDDIIAKRKEVRVVIASRPILGPDSMKLARFSLAASLQGKFAQTHDALYDKFGDDHRTKATDEALQEIARKVGLDYPRLTRDMDGKEVTAMLDRQTALADKIGISGTPFFITSDNVFPGMAPEPVMDKAFH